MLSSTIGAMPLRWEIAYHPVLVGIQTRVTVQISMEVFIAQGRQKNRHQGRKCTCTD